jgi:hypothetical protein
MIVKESSTSSTRRFSPSIVVEDKEALLPDADDDDIYLHKNKRYHYFASAFSSFNIFVI